MIKSKVISFPASCDDGPVEGRVNKALEELGLKRSDIIEITQSSSGGFDKPMNAIKGIVTIVIWYDSE